MSRRRSRTVHFVHRSHPSHRNRARVVAALASVVVCASIAACTSTVSGHGAVGGAAPSATGSPPATQRIAFTDCKALFDLSVLHFPSGREAHLSFLCGRLTVPLDHRNASGKTITLELVKVHDDRNQSGQSLLVNPGGPGGSGFELAVGLSSQLADTVVTHYDIVGFDPRGVGLSSPISCVSNTEKDTVTAASPNVLTSVGFAQAKALAQTVAQGCTSKYGAALAQYNTVQTAQDMDSIRAGLGAATLNYLGFSYGTELGGVYAHLDPSRVGVMVLDGAVDPLTSDVASFATQLGGFEGAFDQFAADCLHRSNCASLGNPRQVVYDLVRKADANPIPTSDSNDHRTATSALVLTGVLSALYSKSEWPALGSALQAAQGGDSKGLLLLADEYNQRSPDGTYTNIYDANTAISCNDSKPGPTDAMIAATAATWKTKYPMFGLWSAGSLFSCQQWQPDRTPVPQPTSPTAAKVLVVGNLHDPATPYQGALDLAKTMGDAEVLTWNGEGHTSYLKGSTCVDNYVNTYLTTKTLPPAHTTCPA
jgi:pimeloyl-ACP methyl ester carboxylesterase